MINIEMLEEIFDGDKEITEQLFELYLSENSTTSQTLLKQYKTEDLSGLFHTVHTLSGALGNLCEVDILPAIKTIEAATRANTKPEQSIVTTVIEGLEQIQKQMEEHLAH
uniref:HPt domain-containing protein n=2 Tax=Aliivibrio wodanis TaxID=80852 RepID=A0A5Q4ZTV3_9GAMM|nr:hypothetical protein AW0309160_03052 [Aliivibrio wodanis]